MGGKNKTTRPEKQGQVVKAVTIRENQRWGKQPKKVKAMKSRKGKSRQGRGETKSNKPKPT